MAGMNMKAENTKNLIATKAKEVFILKGYFNASMEDIRTHSGMSKGSIYYHFKNKEALFLFILEQYAHDWIDSWKDKSAGLKTAKEKLYAIAEHFADDLESPLMNAAQEFVTSQYNPEVKEKLDELNTSYLPIVQKILEEGIRNQEFKTINLEQLSVITYGFLAGIGAICNLVDSTDASVIHKMAVDIFLQGLSQ